MSSRDTCPTCGNDYQKIGQHWSIGPCDWPRLSHKQIQIATGLLMGDGYLYRDDKNAHLQVSMIKPEYLEYIDTCFGTFGMGVRYQKSAEDSAADCRNSGFSPNANSDNYSDVYRWLSKNHPQLNQFCAWYESGKKVWPDDIILTPTVLKHWFCCDGTRDVISGGNSRVHIAMSNERRNKDKVSELFSQSHLPSPDNYNIAQRKDGSYSCVARWNVGHSRILWDYMGNPPPGFEYKWPTEC